MHKAQAGLHTMHVLWGVILLECCLWARGALGAQAMGLPPQSSTCEVLCCVLGLWGGWCVGIRGRSHPSAVGVMGSQDKPSQNS